MCRKCILILFFITEISSTVNTKPSATSVGEINKVLTFAPGVTSNDVSLNISDDSEAGEDDEQYRLEYPGLQLETLLGGDKR